jgi:hypothetical protein
MKRRRRSYRKNAITSDDMMHLAFAGVTGIAIGFIMARKSQPAIAGLGAYFHDPVFQPIHGLGSNYVRVR